VTKNRRRLHPAFLFVAVLFLLCGATQGGTIIDPQMKMLEDELSSAILQGTQFNPNSTGGGVFGFFNATGKTITEITFETLILPNISPMTIASAFVCNQANFNPFFLFCRIDYAAFSGRMTIAFWGTTPPPTDHPGILPLPSGCLSTPDAPGCTGTGHFAVSLSDSFSLSDPNGGWSSTINPQLFLPGLPTFTVTEIQTLFGATPTLIATPEPAMFGLVGVGLAGLVVSKRRRSRPRV